MPPNLHFRFPRLSDLLPSLRKMPASPTTTKGFDEIKEGLARALYHKGAVFYNPAQVVNRDLSILLLRHAAPSRPLRILEALSATGLRSIRYYREIPNVSTIVANDLDPSAVETIARNVKHNGLCTETQIIPNCGDAIEVMSQARSRDKQFDVIDLDPYGSAAPFLDAAVQAVRDDGILCVTCTDLAVLCGNSPEICWARYGATPLKGPGGHEMAVRMIIMAINMAANRHGRGCEVLLGAKIDFYVRVFVRVKDSKWLAQQTHSKTVALAICSDCGTPRTQPMGRVKENVAVSARKRRKKESVTPQVADNDNQKKHESEMNGEKKKQQHPKNVRYKPALVEKGIASDCFICGGRMQFGGPMWGGQLIGEGVAEALLKAIESGEGAFKAKDRVGALVTLLSEEVKSVPMFMHLPSMCRELRVNSPPAAAIRAALAKKGYEVSQSHTNPQAVKTTAPPELVWDILRIWTKKIGSPLLKKLNENNGQEEMKEGYRAPTGVRIMKTEATLISVDEIDFDVKRDKFARKGPNMEKLAARYPSNPEPNWGPKARAGKRKVPDGASDVVVDVDTSNQS